MAATVHFVPYYFKGDRKGLLERFKEALVDAGFKERISSDGLCAIKMHFGERGMVTHLRTAYPRTLVELINSHGSKAFLTDTNTLYRGKRHNAVDHLVTAHLNGFSYGSVGAPIIIADGVHGHGYREVSFDGKHFTKVQIPDAIYEADSMVVLSHFTAHLAAGFGATIKNLSMGCSNPQGKRQMHCHSKPTVSVDDCIGCGECTHWCPTGAITVDDYATINNDECMACGECTIVCPQEAIKIPWDENSSILQEKMAEYAKAVVDQKDGSILYASCLVDITPQCDCMDQSEPTFRSDIGLLVGTDPVAVDQAGLDFINNKIKWDGKTIVEQDNEDDPLRAIYPSIDWRVVCTYAESIGLGTRDYELKVKQ